MLGLLPTGIALVTRLLLLPGIPTPLPLVSVNDPVQILVQNHPPAPSHVHVSLHPLCLDILILIPILCLRPLAWMVTTCAAMTILVHPLWLDDDGLTGPPVPPGPAALLRVIQQRPRRANVDDHPDV
jgi:hypothetical protein